MKTSKFLGLILVSLFSCSMLMAAPTLPFHAQLVYEDRTPVFLIVFENGAKYMGVVAPEPLLTLRLLVETSNGSGHAIDSNSLDVPSKSGNDLVGTMSVLKEMSRRELLPSGLYRFYSKDKEQPWIAVFREESAGKMDIIRGLAFDDPTFIGHLIKEGSYSIVLREYIEDQISLTENTKQYLFAHPYTIALSLDGQDGFRLKLMVTNNTQQPMKLPEPNTFKNRLEIVGLNKDNVWSYPQYPLRQNSEREVALEVGETHSRTEDIGRYLKEKGIRRPGRYTVRWLVEDKEVATFVFYLPETPEKKAK